MAHFQDSPFLVCIDIGASYSGYTFTCKTKYGTNSPKLYTQSFSGGTLLSYKTPTAILLNSNKDLIAFGYEAENQYSELVWYEEQDDYFYINDVKSMFHEQFTPKTLLKDVSGKTIDASEVIRHVFGFFKLRCIENLEKSLSLGNFNKDTDISYVLTVPSTWDETVTRYIIESVEKTGTSKAKICTVSDAVAAYVYYRTLTKKEGSPNLSAGVNEKVLIVDAGGECTKLTVLAIQTESEVSQIATGIIPWGGQSVNRAFIGMMSSIFSQSVMDDLKNLELDDLLRDFERKKNTCESRSGGQNSYHSTSCFKRFN